MKHVYESLKEFNDYKFFKLLEEKEEPGTDKQNLQSKEKDGLAIIDKVIKNFDDFKKDAKGEILKYKEFWEENQQTKKAFSNGDVYKMYDGNYVVGVLELPVETLSDGSIEGGLGATDEPVEEIIEGKELMEATKEEDDLGLDLGLTDEPITEPNTSPAPNEVPADPNTQELEEPAPDQSGNSGLTDQSPVEEPPMDQAPVEEPSPDLTAPQTYLVVYDMSGDDKEEIFRCGSNNVVQGFQAFYNDTFKGSMKNAILQYKKQKEQEKAEAEKTEKKKVQAEKQTKVQKFLGEALEEDMPEDDEMQSWLDEVRDYLISEYEIEEDVVDDFLELASEQLADLFDGGSSAFDAAGTVATDEDILSELDKDDEDEDDIDIEDEDELDDEDLEDLGEEEDEEEYPEDEDDEEDDDDTHEEELGKIIGRDTMRRPLRLSDED